MLGRFIANPPSRAIQPGGQNDHFPNIAPQLRCRAAALPALAVPAIADVTTEPDPTFAVMEAHRNPLFDAMRATKFRNEMLLNDPRYPKAEAEDSAASGAERSAQFELANVVPTTWAGVFALMEYVEALHTAKVALPEHPEYYASVDDDQCGCDHWISKFEVDDLVSPHHGRPLQLPLIFWVMQSIRAALQSLSAVQA
jgi:hypothetical protein